MANLPDNTPSKMHPHPHPQPQPRKRKTLSPPLLPPPPPPPPPLDAICILLPYNVERIIDVDSLFRTLRSLEAQVSPVAIYLSVSFASREIECEFQQLATDYLRQSPYVKCWHWHNDKPLSYFELVYLTINRCRAQHQWVVLAQDGEVFDPRKIANIAAAIDRAPAGTLAVYERVVADGPVQYSHCSYATHISLFDKFFGRLTKYGLQSDGAGLLFDYFMQRYHEPDKIVGFAADRHDGWITISPITAINESIFSECAAEYRNSVIKHRMFVYTVQGFTPYQIIRQMFGARTICDAQFKEYWTQFEALGATLARLRTPPHVPPPPL